MKEINGEFDSTAETPKTEHSRFHKVGKNVLKIIYGGSAFATGYLIAKDGDSAALTALVTGTTFILDKNWPETPRDIGEYLGLFDPSEEQPFAGQQGPDTIE